MGMPVDGEASPRSPHSRAKVLRLREFPPLAEGDFGRHGSPLPASSSQHGDCSPRSPSLDELSPSSRRHLAPACSETVGVAEIARDRSPRKCDYGRRPSSSSLPGPVPAPSPEVDTSLRRSTTFSEPAVHIAIDCGSADEVLSPGRLSSERLGSKRSLVGTPIGFVRDLFSRPSSSRQGTKGEDDQEREALNDGGLQYVEEAVPGMLRRSVSLTSPCSSSHRDDQAALERVHSGGCYSQHSAAAGDHEQSQRTSFSEAASGTEGSSLHGSSLHVVPTSPSGLSHTSFGRSGTAPDLSPSLKEKRAKRLGRRPSQPPTNLGALCEKTVVVIPERLTRWQKAKRFVKKLLVLQLKVYRRTYIGWLLLVVVVFSLLFWGVCWAFGDGVHILDAAFMTVSTITMTGLSTVDLSVVPCMGQAVLWVSMIAASPMLMSIVPVAIRLMVVRHRKKTCNKIEKLGVAFFGINSTLEDDEMVLTAIIITVALYWFFCQFLAWVVYMICFSTHTDYGPWPWHALFLSSSAFHNAGLVTLPFASLPFKGDRIAWPVLLTVALQLMGGNTWAPIALRFLFWIQYKVAVWRGSKQRQKVLNMLLRYPRTCYSHLFPDYATRWLLIAQSGFIVVQVLLWLVETGPLRPMMAGTTTSEYALATIFQSISTRTAGFTVVDLSQLPTGLWCISLVAFWVSTTPVTVLVKSTMRKPHIKGDEELYAENDSREKSDSSALKGQFSNIMAEGLPVLFFLLLVMLVSEDYNLDSPWDPGTRVMHILFEYASAYGTVGLSMSSKAWSDSHYWNRCSQAALMGVMFLGRIRGLPDNIDPTLDVSVWYLEEKLGPPRAVDPLSVYTRRRSASEPAASFPIFFAGGGQEGQQVAPTSSGPVGNPQPKMR